MARLKLMTVVGARPQFVKAAVVRRAIAHHNSLMPAVVIEEHVVHTGQHYDYLMSQVFFEEMDIPPPAVNLQVGSGPHGQVTGAMLAGIEQAILAYQPDAVVVYGDTNSTLAGALGAVKLQVPVAHVEAGLRSFNRRMPEEINRVLTDTIAAYLFCPSMQAQGHLAREGITQGVHVVGDVMYDAALYYAPRARPSPHPGPYAIATLHRAENTDEPRRLRQILAALEQAPIPVLLPLHPRTRQRLLHAGIAVHGQVQLCEPYSYLTMLGHLQACTFVVTDSGGLQKEAYYFGKKCVTVRDETEWSELVACGANRVVGTDEAAICAAFAWALQPLGPGPGLYGQGDAGQRIVQLLAQR